MKSIEREDEREHAELETIVRARLAKAVAMAYVALMIVLVATGIELFAGPTPLVRIVLTSFIAGAVSVLSLRTVWWAKRKLALDVWNFQHGPQ